MTTVAIIGGGNMGEALLAGLLSTKPETEARVVETNEERANYLRERYAVTVTDVGSAVEKAEVILIVVKPHFAESVLDALREHLSPGQVVVSAVGGVSTANLEERLPSGTAVVRCMPNLAVASGRGMIAITAGRTAGSAELDLVNSFLDGLGRVARLPETQLDAVTALSGSGPAYFFLLAEAMIDAGVLLGLPRPVAEELVLTTAVGAGDMLGEPGADPARLRAAVCSPGGTTIAAIREFEDRALRSAVMAAAEAARNRSIQLRW